MLHGKKNIDHMGETSLPVPALITSTPACGSAAPSAPRGSHTIVRTSVVREYLLRDLGLLYSGIIMNGLSLS